MNKMLKVSCPHCKIEFNYYDSEYRPFCCEKCRMIDLGLWLSESYKVPQKNRDEWDEESETESEGLEGVSASSEDSES